jgi:hypothetical protein
MYCTVPTMLPALVSGLKGLGAVTVAVAVNDGGEADDTPGAAPGGLARPKSINFAPLFVSMMFPGFRSR